MKSLAYLFLVSFAVQVFGLNPQEKCAEELGVDVKNVKKLFETAATFGRDLINVEAEKYFSCVWEKRNILDKDDNFNFNNFSEYVMQLMTKHRRANINDQSRQAMMKQVERVYEDIPKQYLDNPLYVKKAVLLTLAALTFTENGSYDVYDLFMNLD